MNTHLVFTFALLVVVGLAAPAAGGPVVVDARLHHLRPGPTREWADFPAEAAGDRLTATFRPARIEGVQTLRLRHQDVKQTWRVLLNGKELGRLPPDENDAELVLPVPAGRLVAGDNTLVVEPVGK